MFSAGSQVLASATQFTQAPVHFSQVTIVLPQMWKDSSCNQTVAIPTGNTLYKHGDIVISGHGPRHTVQGGQCGESGHHIHLPLTHLLDVHKSKVLGNILVSEWSKYRYGTFAEHGVPGDHLYPNYYYHHGNVYPTGPSDNVLTGSWRYSNTSVGCDPTLDTCHYHVEGSNTGVTCSLNNQPELESVTRWCGNETVSGPGIHSVLCQGRSVQQVIAAHPDFATAGHSDMPQQPPVLPPQVQFDVVRVPQPKYVLVIETSARMVPVWQWVRKAILNLIR